VDINVVTLLGGWSRRLAGAPDVLYTMRNRLVLVLQLFQKILVSGDMKLQKEAWIGYVAVIGHSPTAYPDTSILEEMTKMIGMYTKDKERVAYLGENLDAGLAHALANTNALNEFEMASCQSLLEAYIQFAAAREEGPRALMHALEHAVDVRSQGKPEAKAEAEVIMLVKMVGEVVEEDASIQVQFSRLAMLAGVV
jgi:hypothetical protein